jgi:hypothetical protein
MCAVSQQPFKARMDIKAEAFDTEGDMKMTFEPVVAPGSSFDDFGDLEYRLSHDYDDHWMQDDPMDSAEYDAVIRVGTRPRQPLLPPVHPPIPTFEGNAQWLDILLRACAPPGSIMIRSAPG